MILFENSARDLTITANITMIVCEGSVQAIRIVGSSLKLTGEIKCYGNQGIQFGSGSANDNGSDNYVRNLTFDDLGGNNSPVNFAGCVSGNLVEYIDFIAGWWPSNSGEAGRNRIGRLNVGAGASSVKYIGASHINALIFVDILTVAHRWIAYGPNGELSDQITGGQTAAWARGGAGTCLYFNPSSTTKPMRWEFFVPVASGSNQQIHLWVKKTSAGATCSLKISYYGCGITAVDDSEITLTDSWTEYTSASFNPSYSGYVRVVLDAYNGGTSGDIGVDGIHLAAV